MAAFSYGNALQHSVTCRHSTCVNSVGKNEMKGHTANKFVHSAHEVKNLHFHFRLFTHRKVLIPLFIP